MDTPSFEQNLETDMQRLATEIKTQQERPEMRSTAEQELIKEAIRAFPEFKNQPQAAASSTAANTNVNGTGADGRANNSSSPLPAYAQNAAPEVKLEIEYLLDVALKKRNRSGAY